MANRSILTSLYLWRKRNTPPLLVGLQAGTTTLVISLAVPQKTWHGTSRGPCYTTPGHIPRGSPAYNKNTSLTMFRAALFIIARRWKEPRCPSMEEWIQKMWSIYTMECYSVIRNDEIIKFLGKLL